MYLNIKYELNVEDLIFMKVKSIQTSFWVDTLRETRLV